MTLDEQKRTAEIWFRQLRDSICAEFESLEAEYALSRREREGPAPREGEGLEISAGFSSPHPTPLPAGEGATFTRTPWTRAEGGSGEISLMKGNVFEKVGVNISTVHGTFSEQFRHEIPGASDDPRFWASGISLVAHTRNPHAPAAHMNTRMIVVGSSPSPAERGQGEGLEISTNPSSPHPHLLPTGEGANRIWFGGGGDLNPAIPYDDDTRDFHAAFRATCDAASPDFYPAFSQWCEEYFYIPHRNLQRGVGGVFYDYLGLARLGSDTTPVTSGRFGKGGAGGERTAHGMQIANHAPLDWNQAFAFTQNIGTTFRDSYTALVRRRMETPFTEADRHTQLVYRGRYAEYNLLYDRGTRFGLMTGGNPEAILMSLPPIAVWE